MAAKEHKSLQGSKILLIEDDKSIRLTVTESLVSEGFEVLNFKDGSSALDFILGEGIKDVDLILLNLLIIFFLLNWIFVLNFSARVGRFGATRIYMSLNIEQNTYI